MKLARSIPAPPAAPPDTRPALVREIDNLRERLEARLDEFVAEERAKENGTLIHPGVHRTLLLRGSDNFFAAMRRLLSERA